MSEQLFEIAERKAEIRAYLKEVNEAVSAGQSVLQSLRRAESSLNSAGNWGTWDMIGGGAISTAVKHSRINDAQKHVHAAQSKMRRFRHELKDIEMHAEVHFDIGDMLKFADFFFDGLIVDWMVQGRIRSSLDQVRQRAGQISGILNQLRAEAKKMEAELNRLQRQYTSMVESA